MKYLLILIMTMLLFAGCNGTGPILPFEPEDTMTYRYPVTYGVTSTARESLATYNIIAVDTVAEVFTIAGNHAAEFGGGVTFEVNGSTGNDGDWVSAFAFPVGPNTQITVTGDITNAVADGNIKAYTIPTADELRIAFWDTVTEAFVRATICTDSLQNQWTNQRCGIAYKSDGKWGVAHIEAVSNDLEYWQNATAGWIASGAWNLLDDDASQDWLAVDVKTRQNYVWAATLEGDTITPFYINLSAGAPAWTSWLTINIADNNHYSMALDNNLIGINHWVFIKIDIRYTGVIPTDTAGDTARVTGEHDYPQIIVDMEERLWVFYTAANSVHAITSFDNPFAPVFANSLPVYAANLLTSNYKAAHNPRDDTIHVILVDTIPAGHELIYLRRTSNGWSSAITLQTAGLGEAFSCPQITCDSFNQLMVYYIHDGDLVSITLPSADYAGFATPANWDKTVNVDGTGDTIKHCNAISNMPEYK